MNIAFTSVDDLQAALSACLTVRCWEMLTEAVQIRENFVPLAFARLIELSFHIMRLSEGHLVTLTRSHPIGDHP